MTTKIPPRPVDTSPMFSGQFGIAILTTERLNHEHAVAKVFYEALQKQMCECGYYGIGVGRTCSRCEALNLADESGWKP